MKTAYKRNDNIVIAGDFNYKEIDWGNEYVPPSKEHQVIFVSALQDCFMYQHVTEPTRFRPNEKPNLLDLVLSGEESMIQNLDYLPPLGESDHICIRFSAMCGMKEKVKDEPAERNIFKTDYAAVIRELEKYNWVRILNSSFVEDYKRFFDILEEIMVRHTPLRTPKRKKKNLYMTREARRLKNKKIRLWKKFLATKSTYDRNNFTRCKNSFRALTRKLRRDFEIDISKVMKEKPKLLWSYAKSRLKNKDQISTLTAADGSVAATP